MALAGVTLRVIKGSKLTIAELDGNFSAITSSAETATTNITTLNTRVSQSVLAFPNLTTAANGPGGAGLITSGALFVTGAFSVSGSSVHSGSSNFLGAVIASGSGNSVLGSNYANDAAAQAGGIAIGGMYHNAGAVRIRLT
jgi:hypothetical protein